VPGMTHLQPAQPISLGHHLAAHVQSLQRDILRFQDWDRRSAYSPLGAAALAGSSIARHPELSAAELGFVAPCPNSIDAVSDRDFAAEFLFIGALLGVHLSRLGEEICLWNSFQFGWVSLSDRFTTGSSIMPQKKNPDIAELARGRSGRLIGNLTGMLTMIKGLPLAYNRDMSEDKRPLFDTIDCLVLLLPALAGLIRTMRINEQAMERDLSGGFLLATDLADWLAAKGVPFREAHSIVGRLVQFCEETGIQLTGLSDQEMASIDERLTPEAGQVLLPSRSVAARDGVGGTAPRQVAAQLSALRESLGASRCWSSSRDGSSIGGDV